MFDKASPITDIQTSLITVMSTAHHPYTENRLVGLSFHLLLWYWMVRTHKMMSYGTNKMVIKEAHKMVPITTLTCS